MSEWTEMIRKVYKVDHLICPGCGGRMKVVAFITNYQAVNRIIYLLKLTLAAAKAPAPQTPLSRSPDGGRDRH